jgi:hypothetical protein
MCNCVELLHYRFLGTVHVSWVEAFQPPLPGLNRPRCPSSSCFEEGQANPGPRSPWPHVGSQPPYLLQPSYLPNVSQDTYGG